MKPIKYVFIAKENSTSSVYDNIQYNEMPIETRTFKKGEILNVEASHCTITEKIDDDSLNEYTVISEDSKTVMFLYSSDFNVKIVHENEDDKNYTLAKQLNDERLSGIRDKISEMYNNPKSKKFVLHLIHSYWSWFIIEKVFDRPSQNFKCAITGTPLISNSEVLEITNDQEYMKYVSADIKNLFQPNPAKSVAQEHLSTKLNGRVLGFKGKETTTYLCMDAIQSLHTFIENALINGDKQIIFILHSILDKEVNNTK